MYRPGSSRGRTAEYRVRGPADTKELVRALYKIYYRLKPCVEEPDSIANREFAFQLFEPEAYVRHISFQSRGELQEYLAREAPKNAYYSVAYYDLPEAKTMEEKGYRGAILLFDLDLDHYEPCSGNSQNVDGTLLLGDECLIEGLREVAKLEAMIRRDLKPEKIESYYTGHRGYHVRVHCKACFELGREERRQIASYFAGEGVRVEALFPTGSIVRRGRKTRKMLDPAFPSPSDPGLRGWIARILASRASGKPKGMREAFGQQWDVIVEDAIRQAVVPIDAMVTADPSRLTRIYGTLNGKGHFLVAPVREGFRPNLSLTPFQGEVEVEYNTRLEPISILGVEVSGAKGEHSSLPAGVALHLAGKGLVRITGGSILVRAYPCWRTL